MDKIKEMLVKLFGLEDIEQIFQKKESADPKARAATTNKVSRVKLTSDECKALCKKIGLEYQDGYEERVLQYVLTDETVDRYGDIVRAKGGDLKNYMKNPVVLTFHDGGQFPVGNCLKVWHDKDTSAVMGWVLFFGDEMDRTGVAETAYRFASSGAMKYGSIGFIPKETRRPEDKERADLSMPGYGVIYEKWELLEFSLTPIPANPNAGQREAEMVKRGMFTKENIAAAKDIPEFAEIAKQLESMITVVERVKPNDGESKDDFMARCVKFLMENEGKEQDQAVAMCIHMWEEHSGKDSKDVSQIYLTVDICGKQISIPANVITDSAESSSSGYATTIDIPLAKDSESLNLLVTKLTLLADKLDVFARSVDRLVAIQRCAPAQSGEPSTQKAADLVPELSGLFDNLSKSINTRKDK